MSDGDKKICFVIGPIGDPDSDVRIHADWLLEEIIHPVFEGFKEYEVIRADQIARPGMIDAQIIRYLIDSELVIADLSMLNPNAFYEIGVRHMVQKPIIHVQLADDIIPFDVALYRATKFSRKRPSDLRKAREELTKSVAAVNSETYQVENPITRVRGEIKLAEHATPEQQVVLDRLSAMERRLRTVEETKYEEEMPFAERGVPLDTWFVHLGDYSREGYLETYSQVMRVLKHNRIRSVEERPGVIKMERLRGFLNTERGKTLLSMLRSIPGVLEVSEIPF